MILQRWNISSVRRVTILQLLIRPGLSLDLFLQTIEGYFTNPAAWSNVNIYAMVDSLWADTLRRQEIQIITQQQAMIFRGPLPSDNMNPSQERTVVHVPMQVMDPQEECRFFSIQSLEDLHNDMSNQDIGLALKKTLILLRKSTGTDTAFLPASIRFKVPHFVIYFLAKLYPEVLLLRDPETGMTPLHLSASLTAQGYYENDHKASGRQDWNFRLTEEFPIAKLWKEKSSPTALLCHMGPKAARMAMSYTTSLAICQPSQNVPVPPLVTRVSGHRGFTPLECFLYTLLSQPRSSISYRYTNYKRLTWEAAEHDLLCLLGAAPSILETRFPTTGLYPFLVPLEEPPVEKDWVYWERLSLDLSFLLLRANLNLIHILLG